MANLAYTLGGGAPLVKKFKIGNTTAFLATSTNPAVGIPTLVAQTAATGLAPATTGGGVDFVGCTLDNATYTTTQSSTMIEGVVSVVINPDAAYRFRMSGTAADGGALLTTTNTTANSGGLTITITTGDPVPTSPTMVDGTVICVAGNNTGIIRKITSVTATTIVVIVPFPYTIAVGDVFIAVPYFAPMLNTQSGLTLTTNLYEANAITASTTTGFNGRHLDLQFDPQAASYGTRSSYLITMPLDNIWALNT